MIRCARLYAAIAVVQLLLAACAGLAPRAGGPAADAAREVRRYADSIELSGRLSVRYQGAQKEEALHGNFSWVQMPAQTTVTLLSPLGQTIAVIESAPGSARLLQAGQAPRVAADVDALTAQALGWPLPVAGMRDWLQGFAQDAAGHRIAATPGNDEFTTADGWHIRYAAWQEDSPARPRRIDLTRTTAQAGEVSIRIVIDTWQPR